MVGVIFEVDEIYYCTFDFGKIPKHGGNWVKAFKGGNEVEREIEKIVEQLNNGSSAYQKKKEELKKEKTSPARRARKPSTSERERRQIKQMAQKDHARVFDYFS